MTIRRSSGNADQAYQHAIAEKESAARALYSAELAVHDAHQTHVDEWILAAHNHLHEAVVRYSTADKAVAALSEPILAA
jgi:ABC-type molybdenum transport system ATPase subunit/photorepair protein PhrA